jgi:hypothetical protein
LRQYGNTWGKVTLRRRGVMVEYDDARPGGFEPLRLVPPG